MCEPIHSERIDAAKFRHVHIHDYQVVVLFFKRIENFLAILNKMVLMTSMFQNSACYDAVDTIVLSHQNL